MFRSLYDVYPDAWEHALPAMVKKLHFQQVISITCDCFGKILKVRAFPASLSKSDKLVHTGVYLACVTTPFIWQFDQ